jgi:predicted amidohydrolase YtcJ
MNKYAPLLLAALLGCLPGGPTCTSRAQSKPAADLVVIHARIWTVDKTHPEAQAVAVLGDRIVGVGTDADVAAWRGPGTKTIDAGGKLLLPGFNDSHTHFVSGGAQLDNVQLNDATSAQEFARRIGERAKNTPKGSWILGGDWDETKWSPAEFPTKELIDPVTGDTPVFVSRYDGHMGLANTAAIRAAGITAQTPDPPGGAIVRDAQGNPTGALKDAAQDMLYQRVPPLTHDERLHGKRWHCGLTASLASSMSADYVDIAVYAELRDRGN